MAKQKQTATKKMQKKPVNKKTTKKKAKKGKRNIAKNILIGIAVFAGISLIGYRVINLVQKPTDTVMIENGEISLEESAVAYIIRNETIVESTPSENGINPIKNEGEKVAKGDKIFNYYSEEQEELKQKISELNRQISESIETGGKVPSSDVKTLEKEIEKNIDYLYNVNNLTEIEEYKKQIEVNINKKSKIIGETSNVGAEVKNLINVRDGYETQLVSTNKDVKAPISGMVSYRIDGLEDILTPNDFSKITKESLENLNIKTSAITPISIETAKITNNFENYIAVITSSVEAREAKINAELTLRLSNTEKISAKIVHINEEAENRVIIFRITNKLDELVKYRKIKLDIIWWSKSGLKVPNSTIMSEDGKDFVIRNRAGYLDKIAINVSNKNETYSIIENCTTEKLKELGYTLDEIRTAKNISLYDEIISKPTPDMIK